MYLNPSWNSAMQQHETPPRTIEEYNIFLALNYLNYILNSIWPIFVDYHLLIFLFIWCYLRSKYSYIISSWGYLQGDLFRFRDYIALYFQRSEVDLHRFVAISYIGVYNFRIIHINTLVLQHTFLILAYLYLIYYRIYQGMKDFFNWGRLSSFPDLAIFQNLGDGEEGNILTKICQS